MAQDLVAILIIVHKREMNLHEEVSLRQCAKVLQRYPIRLICPQGLDVSAYERACPGLLIDRVAPSWLRTYGQFNLFKMSPVLYARYRNYQYVLFYELDAFVFRDELADWCASGYDYIGAPWIDMRWLETMQRSVADYTLSNVGNGGFSLRRTDAMLRALRSWSCFLRPREIWNKHQGHSIVPRAMRLVRDLTFLNNIHSGLGKPSHEDVFWGVWAARGLPWYRVAPEEVAQRFSFDTSPALLYERTGHELPFGCHGWWNKSEERLSFWRPFIAREGWEV